MRRLLFTGLVFVLFLSACTTATPTSEPTPTVPLITVPSATPLPLPQLNLDTALYSGPGGESYTHIAVLPAGTQVHPVGQFGGFTKIETPDSQSGFVVTSSLSNLPQSIPQLTLSEVPWQDLDLRYNFVGNGGVVQQDQIKIMDINGNGTNIGNGSFAVDSAFRIRMSFHLEKNSGEYASLLLMGTSPAMEGDWWRGLIRMDVGANQQNQLGICLRDGTSDQCAFEKWLDTPADQPFTILFDDPQGKTLHVLDEKGAEVLMVKISHESGLSLPDGFFPAKTVWLDGWVNPNASLTIDSFLAEKAPSGKANLEDIPDLATWVDDYVHAYGGKVTVNGAEMDASTIERKISAVTAQRLRRSNRSTVKTLLS